MTTRTFEAYLTRLDWPCPRYPWQPIEPSRVELVVDASPAGANEIRRALEDRRKVTLTIETPDPPIQHTCENCMAWRPFSTIPQGWCSRSPSCKGMAETDTCKRWEAVR